MFENFIYGGVMAEKNSLILSVEDEPSHAQLIRLALKAAGFQGDFVNVSDGQAALDFLAGKGEDHAPFSTSVPSLILLDLNIPKVDGLEVLKRVKNNPDLSHIPVIILSSSHFSKDIQSAYENSANCYLVKPMGFTDLVALAKGITGFWLGNDPHL